MLMFDVFLYNIQFNDFYLYYFVAILYNLSMDMHQLPTTKSFNLGKCYTAKSIKLLN